VPSTSVNFLREWASCWCVHFCFYKSLSWGYLFHIFEINKWAKTESWIDRKTEAHLDAREIFGFLKMNCRTVKITAAFSPW
jgi:hypothetical protein